MKRKIMPGKTGRGFKPGRLREEVLLSIAAGLAKSSLALSALAVLLAILTGVIFRLSGVAAVVVWIVPLVVVLVKYRVLRYELYLMKETVETKLGMCSKWNVVDDSLYLGSVPMEPSDYDVLIKKLGVSALLSFIDPAVHTANTVVGRAIQPQDWKLYEIQQLVVTTHDTSFTLSIDQLHQSADHLNNTLSAGHKVYVHCRSGKKTGALAVLAYYIKYKGLDPREAYRQLRSKRRLAFSSHNANKEMTCLRKFEESFRRQR